MAIYRTVSMSFWTDSKVIDEFTPEDKYFYLYLFTNPHTNLAGCYEISMKQIVAETGYSRETVENLIRRFETVHNVLRYSASTKEILLLNWYKYNWTSSEKFRKPLYRQLQEIKEKSFYEYLVSRYNGDETEIYGIDTKCIDTTVTVTDTVSDTDTVSVKKKELRQEFETLWAMYPKKQGKDKAYGYYEKARKSGTTYDEVLKGIEDYRAFIRVSDTDMQYVKMGSTFFSQKAWQDEYPVTRKSSNPFMDMLRGGGVNE